METNELTINQPISCFSDEQIKEAIYESNLNGDTPLSNALKLIDAMYSFVVFHGNIDKGIRDEYSVLYSHLCFHLELFKQIPGIEL